MATFYKALSLKPKGEHIIKICNGTACHIKGSMNLAASLKRELGIDPGQTTPDGMFSIELVNCLGSCALAPVMLVDGVYHNKLKPDDVGRIIERYAKRRRRQGRRDRGGEMIMSEKTTLLVCCGTGCIAGGALEVARALEDAIASAGSQAHVELDVKRCGCSGECESGPIVRVMPDDIMYYHVKPKDADAIVASIGGEPVGKLLHKRDGKTFLRMQENPFYAGQTKIVLKNVGVIDPSASRTTKASAGTRACAAR